MSKNILVTGCSKGIGAAVCKVLVERGDIVIGISRNERGYPISERTRWFSYDFSEMTKYGCMDFARVVRELKRDHLLLDGVVLNAGVARKGAWNLLSIMDILNNFDVCVTAHWHLFKALYEGEVLADHCNVINVISHRAFESDPRQPAYCLAKAAQYSLFSSIAKELVQEGVLINHLIPGPVETEMNPITEDESKYVDPHKKPEQVVPAFLYLLDQPITGMADRILDLRRR